MNAYYMLTDIRDNLVESSAKHWGDNDILRKINMSHRARSMELQQAGGDWLIKNATITPSSNVVALPSDCSKPVYMEHADQGWEIPLRQTVRERNITKGIGGGISQAYITGYLQKDGIYVNADSFSDNVKLWYIQRVPKLIAGTADTGSTETSLVLAVADEPVLVDDYYNSQTIEINLQGTPTRTTVSDYVASTRTITVAAGTITASTTTYGTVSDLPEEAIDLIILEATIKCLAKPGSRLDTKYLEFFTDLHKKAYKNWMNWIESRLPGSEGIRITEVD
jgi:hypothetical protein